MRAVDPARSEVYTRDSDSSRIRLPKLVSFIEILYNACKDLMSAFSQVPVESGLLAAEVNRIKRLPTVLWPNVSTPARIWSSNDVREKVGVIQLQLLTAILLLLRKLNNERGVPEEFENAFSKDSAIYRNLFDMAHTALAGLLATQGMVIFLQSSFHQSDEYKVTGDSFRFTELTLAQTLLRVMQLTLPSRSISLVEKNNWRLLLQSSNFLTALLGIQNALLGYADRNVDRGNLYVSWNLQELPVRFPSESSAIHRLLRKVGPSTLSKPLGDGRQPCALASLSSILDLTICVLECGILENPEQLVAVGTRVVQAILTAPLCEVYQQVLTALPHGLGATLAGYDAHTAEESALHACWRRVLIVISTLITSLDLETGHSAPSADYSPLTQSIYQFFNSFEGLILLPFNLSRSRFTLKQLELVSLTTNMFVYANKHARMWRLFCPRVFAGLCERVFAEMQLFTSILCTGDEPLPYQMVMDALAYRLIFIVFSTSSWS